METMTEEKIRTLMIPVRVTEMREVNIALPYYGKLTEFNASTYFKITEDHIVKLMDYKKPHLVVFDSGSPYALQDEEIANLGISDEAEFHAAFDRYRNFINTL